MCGIVGIFCNEHSDRDQLKNALRVMTAQIIHRGPSEVGYFGDFPILLGHRRLSIIELSSAGAQPMSSADGRYTIVYNGEIYNHLRLRQQLEAEGIDHSWKGHSDTETLLVCIATWGVRETLIKLKGMFAFALWDKTESKLYLARDAIGEKPLYWGWAGKDIVFGSELKALRKHPNFTKKISSEALSHFFQFMYVPAPWSIHSGVYKLEPGTFLTVHKQPPTECPTEPLRPGSTYSNIKIERYFSLASEFERLIETKVSSEHEAISLLEETLLHSIESQMLSDVPLGAFLSGGIDSSTIVALMQSISNQPIKTFTIGFEDAKFDEAPYAESVAKHLGTEHSTLTVNEADAMNVVKSLAQLYDEPFADSSQIPTYLVCKAARENITVALSGDGGDELFGGYNRYLWSSKIWNKFNNIPMPVKMLTGYLLRNSPLRTLDLISNTSNFLSPKRRKVTHLSSKLKRLGERLTTVRDTNDLYRSLVTEWSHGDNLFLKPIPETFTLLDDFLPTEVTQDHEQWMMAQDMRSYLPDDILCKVDRAAMGVSLETRVPFLDKDVIALSMRIPKNMKIRGTTGKWVLRQVLSKYIPNELIDRPKAGFAIPIGDWLRTSLRGWAEDLLSEKSLASHGYFNHEVIRKIWAQHISGKYDHTNKLWSLLMFQAWHREWS